MHQFLSDEVLTLEGASETAEATDARGFWRRKKKAGTDKVPEFETA
jgi:hypothetical protein